MTQVNQFPKTVVVLGNARGGTSVTAGILRILGVAMDMSKNPSISNPRGSFESIDVHKINCKIFNLSAGKDLGIEPYWDYSLPEKILAQKNKVRDDIQRFVFEKSKDKKIWGWKNPKTNLTIELFLPYLPNPYFVVVFRNPIKTAESTVIMTMKKIDFYRALRSINFYNQEILRFLEKHPDLPRIFITFEDIINNPIKEAKRLSNFLDLELGEKQIVEINKLVIPREKIERERRKVVLTAPFTYRFLGFAKKCLKNPINIPYYIYLAFKNNLMPFVYRKQRKK